MKNRFFARVLLLAVCFVLVPNFQVSAKFYVNYNIDQKAELTLMPKRMDGKFEMGFHDFEFSTCNEMYDKLYSFFAKEGNEETIVSFPKNVFSDSFYEEMARIISFDKIIKMSFHQENGKEYVNFSL